MKRLCGMNWPELGLDVLIAADDFRVVYAASLYICSAAAQWQHVHGGGNFDSYSSSGAMHRGTGYARRQERRQGTFAGVRAEHGT